MTQQQMLKAQKAQLLRNELALKKERERLTQNHEEYLRRDVAEIYSAMAVVLHNMGNSQDEIISLIDQIGAEWTEHVQNRAPKTHQTMVEYCAELTGIDLMQSIE